MKEQINEFVKSPNLAFSSPADIQQFQNDMLKNHIAYCKQNSAFYKKLLNELGLDVDALTLDSLSQIPPTTKADLGAANSDFYAVPPERVVDIVLSSGTTGYPTQIIYTEEDLQRLSYNEAASLVSCGINSNDTALLTCTLDRCFIAGLAYFSGLREIGTAVIRNGQNTLESHANIIKRLEPSVIVGVPSFLKKLGGFLKGNEEFKESIKAVKKLVCIGEPLRDINLNSLKLASDLESIWSAQLYSTYASSETITSFCECEAGKGGHLLPDLGYVEILDENDSPLPLGEVGEVVVTPFAISAMPLIRFKTGDISFLIDTPCECGRNTPRLGPILGRKAQMLKIRGTTLYPNAVFSALEDLEAVEEFYLSAGMENELSDTLEVHVAVNDSDITPESIESSLQARLRVKPRVTIDSMQTIRSKVFDPSSRKPIRFFDNRKQ